MNDMRTIRLRGKKKNDGEWVVGEMCLTSAPCITHVCKNTWHVIENGTPTPLVTDTVTESTGLCDRNGKEIFEGDIVRFLYGVVPEYETRKEDLTGRVCRDKYNNWCVYGNDDLEHHIENAVNGAVIGNVFDNPELLTDKGNGNGDRQESKD